MLNARRGLERMWLPLIGRTCLMVEAWVYMEELWADGAGGE